MSQTSTAFDNAPQRPLDIETMRAAACEFLAQDAGLPRHDVLDEKALQLRGHLALLVPRVESLVRALPAEDATRTLTQASIDNARVRLNASPGPGLVAAVKHARSLARELRTLCDSYEALTRDARKEPCMGGLAQPAEWVIEPAWDTNGALQFPVREVLCTGCGLRSEPDPGPIHEPSNQWAIRHASQTGHRDFREITKRRLKAYFVPNTPAQQWEAAP